MSEYVEVVQTLPMTTDHPRDRHVTGASRVETPFGSLTAFITLTEDGKPLPPTDEPEHILGGFCWCQPLVERDDVMGSHLFIHRRSVDSPHIEVQR